MGILSPLVSLRGGIAGNHGSTSPASQSHQVAFGALIRKPEVGEGMPEDVRKHMADTSLSRAFLDYLVNAAVCHGATFAKP